MESVSLLQAEVRASLDQEQQQLQQQLTSFGFSLGFFRVLRVAFLEQLFVVLLHLKCQCQANSFELALALYSTIP